MVQEAEPRKPGSLLVGAVILLLGPVSLVLNPLPPQIVAAYGIVGVIVGALLAPREPALAVIGIAVTLFGLDIVDARVAAISFTSPALQWQPPLLLFSTAMGIYYIGRIAWARWAAGGH